MDTAHGRGTQNPSQRVTEAGAVWMGGGWCVHPPQYVAEHVCRICKVDLRDLPTGS